MVKRRRKTGRQSVSGVWNHPVLYPVGFEHKILVHLDYLWMTTLLGGTACVLHFSTLLRELAKPDRLQLPPASLLSPSSVFLSPSSSHPLHLRCWDAMLCRRLITRVVLGGDEGRSPSGSDSCLCRSANCCRAVPSVCDKCWCYWQKLCHNSSFHSTSITVNPGKMRDRHCTLVLLLLLLCHYMELSLTLLFMTEGSSRKFMSQCLHCSHLALQQDNVRWGGWWIMLSI